MIMKDLCIFHSMFTLEYLSRYLFSFTFDSEMIHALLAIMLLLSNPSLSHGPHHRPQNGEGEQVMDQISYSISLTMSSPFLEST
jgi:hypothetical protein